MTTLKEAILLSKEQFNLMQNGIFVSADVSPKTGNWEWFFHNIHPSIDQVLKEEQAPLILESESHKYQSYYEALKEGIKESKKHFML